jgi:predicted enzyme related to lactoylglutathione lyase
VGAQLAPVRLDQELVGVLVPGARRVEQRALAGGRSRGRRGRAHLHMSTVDRTPARNSSARDEFPRASRSNKAEPPWPALVPSSISSSTPETSTARARFYAEVCGWRPERITAPARGSYLALDMGCRRFGGGIVECATERPSWLPYVEVPEVGAATERAHELGAAVLLAPREGPAGWRSVVESPAGGEIAFWQQKLSLPAHAGSVVVVGSINADLVVTVDRLPAAARP